MFIIDSMSKGGAERVIANLANYFSRKNNVTLMTLADKRIEYDLNENINVKSLGINSKRKNFIKKVLFTIKNINKLKRYLKNNKQEIVISFLPRASYYSIIACKLSKTKLVISERNNPSSIYNGLLKRIFTRFLYAKANGMVFQTAEAMAFFGKKNFAKSIVIANPVSEIFYENYFLGQREKKIVAVGRLSEQKNYFMLVNAINKIRNKIEGYKVYIYGEGPLEDDIKKAIEKYGLEDIIAIKGVTNNIKGAIEKAQVYVMTSNYEGMPNSLMEALTMGIPCIATDCPCGGPKELIDDGINGYLCSVNNDNELSSKLLDLIYDYKKQDMFSKNSRKKMLKYKENVINEKWEEYILGIVNGD